MVFPNFYDRAAQLDCIACLTLASHDLQAKIVPESILQTCIKISNEPPSDMRSNMRRAFAAFNQEMCNRYPVLPPVFCTARPVLPDKAFVCVLIKVSYKQMLVHCLSVHGSCHTALTAIVLLPAASRS